MLLVIRYINTVNPHWKQKKTPTQTSKTKVVASHTINLSWETISTVDKGISSFYRLAYVALKMANYVTVIQSFKSTKMNTLKINDLKLELF